MPHARKARAESGRMAGGQRKPPPDNDSGVKVASE